MSIAKLSGKADIMEWIACMAQLGCVRCQVGGDDDVTSLSCVTFEVKEKLCSLPKFSSVEHWSKAHKGVLQDFTFRNLLWYISFVGETRHLIWNQCGLSGHWRCIDFLPIWIRSYGLLQVHSLVKTRRYIHQVSLWQKLLLGFQTHDQPLTCFPLLMNLNVHST